MFYIILKSWLCFMYRSIALPLTHKLKCCGTQAKLMLVPQTVYDPAESDGTSRHCYTTSPLCLIATTCRDTWRSLLKIGLNASLLDAIAAVCLCWCNQRHFATDQRCGRKQGTQHRPPREYTDAGRQFIAQSFCGQYPFRTLIGILLSTRDSQASAAQSRSTQSRLEGKRHLGI